MARYKLVSDGTPQGTRLYDNRNGTEIKGVRFAQFHIGVGNISCLKIELVDVEAEVATDTLFERKVKP
jgi:hypothetical protein